MILDSRALNALRGYFTGAKNVKTTPARQKVIPSSRKGTEAYSLTDQFWNERNNVPSPVVVRRDLVRAYNRSIGK